MGRAPGKPQAEGFHGFGRGALAFFEQLSENNNRGWFTQHREIYDREILAPLGALVSALCFAFQTHDIAFTGDAKRSVFRVNRDVRFSKNKSPYKTNASFAMSRDGSKQGTGILYFQLGGGEGAWMAQGFYAPEPDDLAALRHAIADAPTDWAKVEKSLAAGKLTLSTTNTLARLPRGFEQHAGTPVEDILRLKSLVVRRSVAEKHLYSPTLIDQLVAFAQDGVALLGFGRAAIDRGRVERA